MTAFKKTLSAVMAAVFVFSFAAVTPLTVFAADEETTAVSVPYVPITAEKFKIVPFDKNNDVKIIGYIGSDTVVTIPSSINGYQVTAIGENAFAGNTTITKVKLTTAITELGDGAFKGCTALKDIEKLTAVTTFGVSCFEGCTSLEDFTVPDSVTAIPEKCFFGCKALQKIKPHKNIKKVAKDAFAGTAWENSADDGALAFGRVLYSYKGDITDLIIPKGVEIIEGGVFIGCQAIESVTFGEDVEEIGCYAFQNCTKLKTLKFGTAVSLIDAGAFKGCTALDSADFSDCSITVFGYQCFYGCSALSKLKVSDTLNTINDYAFYGTKIDSLSFGKNVATIGTNVFYGDTALSNITVASGNKKFSSIDGVLYSKDGKTLVLYPAAKKGNFEVPKKVETIQDGAFANTAVSNLTFTQDTALKSIGAYAFENSAIESISVPMNVTTINNSAFKDCSKLTSVALGKAVSYIGASAFEGCEALLKIDLPDTLRDVAAYAFRNTGLVSASLGNGVIRLDTQAFADNPKLADLSLGNSVQKIGDGAFANCTALKAISLPKTTESFLASSFSGCTSLTKITVDNTFYKSVGSAVYSADGKELVLVTAPSAASYTVANGTETICAGAFDLARRLQNITFPDSLLTVCENALNATAWFGVQSGSVIYAGKMLYKVVGNVASLAVKDGTVSISENAVSNPAVKSVSIPSSVRYIGDYAFKGASLSAISIPSGVAVIGDSTFEGDASLRSISLPSGLKELGSAVFKGCSALASVSIPEKIKAIEPDTFCGCTALSSLSLGQVEAIAKYAFSGCKSLKQVALPAQLQKLDPLSFTGCASLAAFTIADGSKTYQAKDGVIFSSANNDGTFDTLFVFPAGKSGEYTIPDNIKNVADMAFYNCDGLTGIKFSKSVENVGTYAFFDCDAIKSVDVPGNVKQIGDYAFSSCDGLREFIVHSNLTKYPDNVFDGCWYFTKDNITLELADSSSSVILLIVAAFAVIAVLWVLVYKRKQKRADKIAAKEQAKEDELLAEIEAVPIPDEAEKDEKTEEEAGSKKE